MQNFISTLLLVVLCTVLFVVVFEGDLNDSITNKGVEVSNTIEGVNVGGN